MFKRYWRRFPWSVQLFMLGVLTFVCMLIAQYLILRFFPSAFGIKNSELLSIGPDSKIIAIKAAVFAQAIGHIATFTVPALLFAFMAHPRVAGYLGFRKPQNPLHWLYSGGIVLGLLPFFLTGAAWVEHHVHLGGWADKLQKANTDTTLAFLKLRGPGMLPLLLFILALLPAFGEEIMFRGILLRLFHHRNTDFSTDPESRKDNRPRNKMMLPIILTSLLFALIHFSPYGFVFLFLAGCMLALIYYLTGSLWCNIWAHFLYNGIQVAIVLLGSDASASKVNEGGDVPFSLVLAGLLLGAGSLYGLFRSRRPLPPDWSEDYLPAEKSI